MCPVVAFTLDTDDVLCPYLVRCPDVELARPMYCRSPCDCFVEYLPVFATLLQSSAKVAELGATTLTLPVQAAESRDLQFIRMNGTLVGGLVGVEIHAVSRVL